MTISRHQADPRADGGYRDLISPPVWFPYYTGDLAEYLAREDAAGVPCVPEAPGDGDSVVTRGGCPDCGSMFVAPDERDGVLFCLLCGWPDGGEPA